MRIPGARQNRVAELETIRATIRYTFLHSAGLPSPPPPAPEGQFCMKQCFRVKVVLSERPYLASWITKELRKEGERERARERPLNTQICPRRPPLLTYQKPLSTRIPPCPSVDARSSCIADVHTPVYPAGLSSLLSSSPSFSAPCGACDAAGGAVSSRPSTAVNVGGSIFDWIDMTALAVISEAKLEVYQRQEH